MSRTDPNNIDWYYAKGQKDFVRGIWDPPCQGGPYGFQRHEFEQEQIDAYTAGHEHAQSQANEEPLEDDSEELDEDPDAEISDDFED